VLITSIQVVLAISWEFPDQHLMLNFTYLEMLYRECGSLYQ